MELFKRHLFPVIVICLTMLLLNLALVIVSPVDVRAATVRERSLRRFPLAGARGSEFAGETMTEALDPNVRAQIRQDLIHLKKAYPEYIKAISASTITWFDGTRMPVADNILHKNLEEKLVSPSLLDQINEVNYSRGIPKNHAYYTPNGDPGRIRYEPFFRKMYGNSKQAVEAHLVTIYWMPNYFGMLYPLRVTQVNHIDKKLNKISTELEALVSKHPEYLRYLANPGGTYQWRLIANTHRLSLHSFGMTIDINSDKADYWQWELLHNGQLISEQAPLRYRNRVPWEIIPIFEKYGFIWGGKWYHYDSMHFEYRPELC